MKTFIGEGKAIGKEAYTNPIYWTNGVEVKEVSTSRSGNRWSFTIQLSKPNGWVCIQDISKTGEHHCFLVLEAKEETIPLCQPNEPIQCRTRKDVSNWVNNHYSILNLSY